jgi:hypothetical protein
MADNQLFIIERVKYGKELKLKIERFQKLGYHAITEKDLLSYLLSYRWANKNRWTTARKKKDLLEVQAYEYFDYQRILAARSTEAVSECQAYKNLI